MSLGFYFDSNKCIGCRTCQVACKDVNDLEVGALFRKVTAFDVGTYPNVDGFRYSGACNHCSNPACEPVCPVGAITTAQDGTVQLDKETCIGCRLCVTACPYDAIDFVEHTNTAGKCDSCADLRALGETPACVASCLMRCIDFGDRDALISKYGLGLVRQLPILPNASATQPNLLINPKPVALSSNFRKVEI